MRRRRSTGRLLLAALGLSTGLGCGPPLDQAILTPEGVPVRLTSVSAILNNGDLTDEEKRDSLIAIGITDDTLLDFLIAL